MSGLAGSAYAPTCPTRQPAELRHVLGVLAAGGGPHAPADVLVVLVFGDFGERRDEGERRVGQHFDPQATDGAGVLDRDPPDRHTVHVRFPSLARRVRGQVAGCVR